MAASGRYARGSVLSALKLINLSSHTGRVAVQAKQLITQSILAQYLLSIPGGIWADLLRCT